MSILRPTVNFLHDLSAAGLLWGVLLAVFFCRYSKKRPLSDQTRDVFRSIFRSGTWVLIICLLINLASGVCRVYWYKQYELTTNATAGTTTALALKHVVLAVLLIAGATTVIKAKRSLERK